MSKDMLETNCSIIKVDIADKKEKYLIDNMFLKFRKPQPGIFVVFGMGKGLYFLTDPSKENMIIDIVQSLEKNTNVNSFDLQPRLLLDVGSIK
ncbi:MAG: hypothetical protein ABIA63_06915 [bacterium]